MQDKEIKDVADFHRKFGQIVGPTPGHLTPRKLAERIRFLQEELDELRHAGEEHDMAKAIDALIDLVYVAKGTAVMMGFEKTWHQHWDTVQRANMAKVAGVGPRGNKVDVVKPDGWVGPNHLDPLWNAGYRHDTWLNDTQTKLYAGRDDAANAANPGNEGITVHLDGQGVKGPLVVDGGP